jgi:hypothetical protein
MAVEIDGPLSHDRGTGWRGEAMQRSMDGKGSAHVLAIKVAAEVAELVILDE